MMTVHGLVLLADDEESFRESTCRLLERRGFQCQCAADADQAVAKLQQVRYDVLISDIRMPRNPDLRVVREARALDNHLPIILVTGYPAVDTAIRGINMAVDAYLTKPFDIDDLVAHIRKGVERSHIRRRLASAAERLRAVLADLESDQAEAMWHDRAGDEDALVTIRTLAACLSDLLAAKPPAGGGATNLCDLLDCPQRPMHRQAILHAIDVLEKTKENFKSKQLAELRAGLEEALGLQ
jgi:DNA-binding response OmpR family regulator